ncbi:MAG TPA: hypothetical protein VI336_03470 [Candidatus Saccharimonadales bacterium]|nr:hypothetical protein [Candidatus Saccharimonadales bacterium]
MRLFPNPRPYWHVDAKWICGILLVFTLSATLILLSLVKLTEQERAPTVGALIIGMGFIRGNTVDTEEAREALAEAGGVIQPIPNVPSIKITEADLALTPSQISIKVFKPITESIYNNGIEATADKFGATAEQKAKFIKDAALFNIFTKDTHQTLKKFFNIFAVLSLLLAAGVVYFSTRWGRLSNLGSLILLVSLPGTLIALLLKSPPKDGNGGFGSLSPELTEQIGQAVSAAYTKVTLLGLLLLAAALLGRIYSAFRKHPKPAKPIPKRV